jgi:hypothetical protein
MSLVSGEITKDGATIIVLVGVSKNRRLRLEKAGLKVPTQVTVRAQLDTGSFATGFMPEVFQSLGVERFRDIPIRTPSTKRGQECRCDQYDVSVTLLSGMTQVVIPSVHAIASDDFDPEEEGVQAIIGRDILDRCTFYYHGVERSFQLSLPYV